MNDSVEDIVGEVVVHRGRYPNNPEDPVEIKLVWTINKGPECGQSGYNVDMTSRAVNNEEMGLVGQGNWTLRFVQIPPDSVFRVSIQHAGATLVDLGPHVWVRGVLRMDPKLYGQPEKLNLNREELVRCTWLETKENHVWKAGSLVVEMFVSINKRKFIENYSAVDAHTQTEALLLTSIREMYAAQYCTDAVLVAPDKQEIKLHRMVLIAHSRVFRALFEHDTVEKKTGIVKIQDVNYTALKIMADFCYALPIADKLQVYQESVFMVADKYQVDPLKQECIEALDRTLTVGNVVDRLLFAKDHDLTEHDSNIVQIVRDNYQGFVDSGGISKLVEKATKYHIEFLQSVDQANKGKKRTSADAGL